MSEPTIGADVAVPILDFTLCSFECHLEDGVLTALPTDEFSSAEAARQVLWPCLRSWAVWSLLVDGVAVDITFESAQLGDAIEEAAATTHFEMAIDRPRPKEPTLRPPPDSLGRTSEDVPNAARRWREVLEGGETTSSGAYAVLTVLEHKYGDRRGVASALQVDPRFLHQLGQLTATGDTRTGRKVAKEERNRRSLTGNELRWVEGLIERLLVRALIVDSGGAVAPLTPAEYTLDTSTYVMSVGQQATLRMKPR